jgi:thiol-disulfide isomerase/thioredoxin
MKRLFILILSLIFHLCGLTQTQKLKALTLGSTFPQIAIKGYSGAKDGKFRISDYKGKLVILDFWGVSCQGCVKLMPYMDSLQSRFKDQIQVVLVTGNTKEEVEKLLSRVKIHRPTIPMITEDKMLHQLFPHIAVPHHVWINGEGKVEQITEAYSTTEANVQATLQGKKLQLPLKSDLLDFDMMKPLWLEGGGRLNYHLQHYSYLMSRISEYPATIEGGIYDPSEKKMGIKMLNMPLMELYKTAHFEVYSNEVPDNLVVVEVKNRGRFYEPVSWSEKDSWKNENEFSYELAMPLGDPKKRFEIMRQDLDRYFNYEAHFEKRKVKCLVLTRFSTEDKFSSKGGKSFDKMAGDTIIIQNCPLSTSLVSRLKYAYRNTPLPVVDGTGYSGKVDLIIPGSLNNLTSVNNQLHHYGLDLSEKQTEIEVLVIKDR